MDKITRKGIAFEPKELKDFDLLIKKKGYNNRSEALRDLIRKELNEQNIRDPEKIVKASLTMVFDHHKHDLQHELTHKQHDNAKLIRSTIHVHIDEDNCMEVLILDGKVKEIKKFADSMLATKGVMNGRLVMTSDI